MHFPADSVGLITPASFLYKDELRLACGKQLPEFTLVYETYGKLNAERDNAILVCHALSGNHHAAGFHSELDTKPGWWDNIIGPGKPLDTNRFFIVCPNNLGGCHGSTGPLSDNPATGQAYGSDFPLVTVVDWVRSQRLLRNHLGIAKWLSVVGASLGGMQALQWAIDCADEIDRAVVIAAAPKLSAQNIAFNEIARRAITSDPDYHQGHYSSKSTYPRLGLMLARMLGHVTYLSDALMHEKFGRNRREGDNDSYSLNPEFMVETYLHYQSNKFAEQFDANTYLLMTRALDYFDPASAFGNDLIACMAQTACRFLLISFSSDWRFTPRQSEELVTAMLRSSRDVSYACISSDKGHDSFLMSDPLYHRMVAEFLHQPSKHTWTTQTP